MTRYRYPSMQLLETGISIIFTAMPTALHPSLLLPLGGRIGLLLRRPGR
jgi:hypothetical protein